MSFIPVMAKLNFHYSGLSVHDIHESFQYSDFVLNYSHLF